MKARQPLFLRVGMRLCLGVLMLVGLCIALGLQARPAHAATTITVSTCDESHMDAAISQANADNAGDIITFSCSGDITLTSTLTITGNMALNGSGQNVTLDGGGSVQVLFVNPGVQFTLNDLTIAHGSSSNSGGGLANNRGTVSINNSTFADNSAVVGGGLYNAGTVNITNSTFANNSATGGGGGLFNFKFGSTMTISESTIADNSAGVGGGVSNEDSNVNIHGSIVANNTGGDCVVGIQGFNDQGNNLSSDSSCDFISPGDLQNTNPQLSALADNGGPTQTMALQQGSPAIDDGSSSCPFTDQRGDARPDNGETTCDIGAYEFQDPVDNDLGLTNMPGNITTNATSPQGAVVTYAPPTVVDEDNPLPAVNCSPAAGSTFAIGTTTVTCTVTDSDDTNSPVSKSFTVTVNPVLSVSVATVTGSEGAAFSGVVATGTAYGSSNPLSATITWGDGSSSTVSVTPNPDGSYSVLGSHTYAEEGSYVLAVSVKDSGSLSASGSGSAQVADAALSLTHFVAGPLEHRSAGVAATFTDADPAGTVSDYTATINWGDGTTSTVKVYKNPLGKGFVLAGLHSYASKGTYSVTVIVTDQGGSQVSKTVTFVVK